MLDHQLFLDKFFKAIDDIGVDISDLALDHIAYQTSSPDDYDKIKTEYSKLSSEIREEIIGGRRISVYKLNKPLTYKNYVISVFEVIEPKTDQKCDSSFQHVEFVFSEPFEKLIDQYSKADWDLSSMNRERFAHVKINLGNGMKISFLNGPVFEMFKKNS